MHLHTYTHVHTEQKSEELNPLCESPTYKEWSGKDVPVQYGKQQTSLVTAWPIKHWALQKGYKQSL